MVPLGVMRPILLPPASVNQRLPSGPAVMPWGRLSVVGIGNSVIRLAGGGRGYEEREEWENEAVSIRAQSAVQLSCSVNTSKPNRHLVAEGCCAAGTGQLPNDCLFWTILNATFC